ncbi:hypothetical protein SLS55_009851 [Diplodia seriata]|uniref:Uncharacterized protein n=1 Tax=Diplodia seriata TaxID=420778 RepID=A0ABR3C3S1_9PEZI
MAALFSESQSTDVPWQDGDPTNGHVQYVNESWATQHGLVGYGDSVYMGVDHTNTYSETGPGRPSVRLESKKVYNHGLFILDLNHMPIGYIIEGVNNNLNNTNKIYTSNGCSITGKGQTAIADSFDCADGCGSANTRTDGYGNGFNKADGGVYAMEWTSQWIRIWFFPRSGVPGSIGKGSPDISEFGTPTANFQGGCDIDQHFKDHTIIFDITFCGDWAGPTFDSPESFKDAYWDINSMRVFQRGNEPVPADSSSVSISDAVSLSSSVGVPLGKSRAVAPSSAIFAEGADPLLTSATPTTSKRQKTGLSSPSPGLSSNSGDSSPANAAFGTAPQQPACTPIGGYDGTGLIGYRHGIGAISGGLAMCQEDCAESARCTAVLYAHYESDFGSPLGYWDCWWGALDVGSVLCGSGGTTSSRNGKRAHLRAHSKRKVLAKKQGTDTRRVVFVVFRLIPNGTFDSFRGPH